MNSLAAKQYVDLCQKYGKPLGEGSYGSVFGIDDETVIKLGKYKGDKYIPYIKTVGLRSANVHFPHVHTMDFVEDKTTEGFYFLITMERLLSYGDMNMNFGISYGILEDYFIERGLEKGYNHFSGTYIASSQPTTQHLREVKRVLSDLYKKDHACCDLGYSNVMWRYRSDGSYDGIFTDPVS